MNADGLVKVSIEGDLVVATPWIVKTFNGGAGIVVLQAIDVVVALSDAIAPEEMIFGVGFGPLSTRIDPDVARMDGPCLHRAREALDEVNGDRICHSGAAPRLGNDRQDHAPGIERRSKPDL